MDAKFQWVMDLDTSRSPGEQPTRELATGSVARAERGEPGPAVAQLLTRVPLFRELPSQQLKRFMKLCTPISIERGQTVCMIDSPSEELYVLLSGELAVLLQDDVCVAMVRPVTTVGEMGFVTRCPRTATLRAMKSCSMLSIRNSQLHAMLQTDAGMHLRVYRNIIEILTTRIVAVNYYMRDHLLEKARRDRTITDLNHRMEITLNLLAGEAGMTVDEAVARIDSEMPTSSADRADPE